MKQLIAAQICAGIVSHASARRPRNYFDIACKLKFSIDANRLVYFSGFLFVGFLSPLKFVTGRFLPGGGGGGGSRIKVHGRSRGGAQGGRLPLFSYQTEARRTEKTFF